MTPIPLTKIEGCENLPINLDINYSGHHRNGFKIAVSQLNTCGIVVDDEVIMRILDTYDLFRTTSEQRSCAKAIASSPERIIKIVKVRE